MESLSIDELMRQIAREDPSPSRPGCYYSKDGDCVFCHVEDVSYTAERVDELLTVYLADDDRRLVGAQIKGVSRLPHHDALGLSLRREGSVQVIELLLLTFRRQEPKAALESDEVLRRKATYLDVMAQLQGLSIPAKELQLV